MKQHITLEQLLKVDPITLSVITGTDKNILFSKIKRRSEPYYENELTSVAESLDVGTLIKFLRAHRRLHSIVFHDNERRVSTAIPGGLEMVSPTVNFKLMDGLSDYVLMPDKEELCDALWDAVKLTARDILRKEADEKVRATYESHDPR